MPNTTISLNLDDFFSDLSSVLSQVSSEIDTITNNGSPVALPTPVAPGGPVSASVDPTQVIINGTSAGEVIQATQFFNIINAKGGNDTIVGRDGVHLIQGGAGIDTIDFSYLNGGSQGAFVDLGNGIAFSGGNDVDLLNSIENVIGSKNADILLGDSGSNVFFGNGGNDLIVARGGVDVVQLKGKAEDYTFSQTADGQGIIADGPDGMTYIYGVEFLLMESPGTSGGQNFFQINNAVIAHDDSFSAIDEDANSAENGAVTLDLLSNDQVLGTAIKSLIGFDDGNGNFVSSVTGSFGAISVAPDGTTVTYETNDDADNLAEGETATETFTYKVPGGDTATVTFQVIGTNDAPVAVADTDSATEDAAAINGSVASNDSDVDNNAVLTFSLDAPVAGLTLNPDGSYSFDPSDAAYQSLADGEQVDVVASYTVEDEHGASDQSTLTITVTGTNDAPVAVADTDSATEDAAAINGSVASNDSDVDNNAVLTFSLDAPVAGLTLNPDGSYSFDPSDAAYQSLADGEQVDVVASYTVEDEHGASDQSTLTITVTGTNDAPVAAADTDSATEDAAPVTGSIASNDSDVDNNAVLTFSLDAPIAGLTLNPDGSYSFDPSDAAYQSLADGEQVDVAASYTVEDEHGASDQSTLTITVTGTNDAPVAVADTDSVTEDSAPVTGSVATNDSDVDNNAVLTFSLDAPVAGLTLNPDGSYSFDPSDAAYQSLADGEQVDVVASYTVEDEHGASDQSTLTITVTGTNDAPVAVADTDSATEDAAAINGSVATNDSDVDNNAVLTFSLDAPIAGLTLNPDGSYSFDPSDAAYQSLADGEQVDVVASYTVEDEHGASDQSTLTITVTGTNDAPVAVADTDSATEDAAAINGSVASNDSDVDNNAVLTFSLDAPVAGLTLNPDGSYSFDPSDAAYQSLADGEQVDVVASYTVEDEHGASDQSTLTITVTGTNDAPVAVADTDSATEDSAPVTGSVATNDSDVDNNAVLTFSLDAPVAGLTLNPDGSYSFDPSDAAYQSLADGEQVDVVASYTVEDEHGASDQSTLTITVTGTNDAPVAVADTDSATEDAAPVTGSVATNDSDVDNNAVLTFSLDAPIAGLTLNPDGSYSFDPSDAAYQSLADGEQVDVVASYTVEDEHGASDQSTLTITVTGTNDAPVAVADTDSATEDAAPVTGSVATNDSDVDNNAVLTFSLDAPIAGLTLNPDGSYSFDPSDAAYQSLADGEQVDVVASYTVEDEHGASDQSTLTITVTGTNDAPVAAADTDSATEDAAAINGSVASNDSDVDNNAVLTFSLDAPVAGLTLNPDGSYSFDPSDSAYQSLADGEQVDVVASYTVEDEHGASDQSTLTITVTGTNDAPVAVADTDSATEDASAINGSVASNDSDVDNNAVLTFSLDAPVAGLTLNPDGSYSFDPSDAAYQSLADGEQVDVVASYTVEDEHGASDQSTLTITVTGTNDAPVAVADTDSAMEDAAAITGSVASNDSDVDNNAVLTFSLDAPIAGLTLNPDGSYSFDPSDAAYQSLADGEQVDVVASYTVEDEHGASDQSTLTITVTGTNDAPVAVADTDSATEDSAPVTGSVATNDSDVDNNAVLTFSLDAPIAGLTLNPDGSYSFDPSDAAYQSLADGEQVDVVASYTVEDEHGASDQSTLTITVTGTNDAPVAVADTDSATEDAAAINGSVATNDSDVDNNAVLTFSLDAPVAGLTLNPDGSYSFDPSDAAYQSLADGEQVDVVASYTVEDEHGASDQSTLTITVTGTNDAPVAVADTDNATEDAAAINGSVATNDSDVDNNAVLTFSLDAPIAGLTLNPDGSYSFDPSDAAYQSLADGEQVDVVASYTVEDEHGASDQSTLTITVTGTNDAPVAVADTDSATEDAAPVTGSVATNDSDVDNNAVLTFSLDAPVAGLTLNPDGSYSFDPSDAAYQSLADGEQVDVVASYTVEDEHGASDQSTLTITVTGTNDAPVAVADTDTTEENTAVSVDVLANDTDVDSNDNPSNFSVDSFNVVSVSGIAAAALTSGSVSIVNNEIVFDPGTDFDELNVGDSATVVIDYTMSDDSGAQSSSTLTVTVTGTNDAPELVFGQGSLPAVVTELPDGDPFETVFPISTGGTLTVLDVDSDFQPSAGLATAVVKSFSYNPAIPGQALPLAALDPMVFQVTEVTSDPGTHIARITYAFTVNDGAIEFLGEGDELDIVYTVTIADGDGGTVSTDVAIQVVGSNDAPVILVGESLSVDEEADASSQDISVNGSLSVEDLDIGDNLTATTSNGLAAYNGGAVPTELSGAVAKLLAGTFSFAPTVTDGGSVDLDFTYAANDLDLDFLADGDQLVVTFDVEVSDGLATSAPSTITITINGTNDDPEVSDVSIGDAALADASGDNPIVPDVSGNVYEDCGLHGNQFAKVAGDALVVNGETPNVETGTDIVSLSSNPVNASDPDNGDAAVLKVTQVSNTTSGQNAVPSSGQLMILGVYGGLYIAADGAYRYELFDTTLPAGAMLNALAHNQVETEEFTFTVEDQDGGSTIANLSFTVIGTNDAAVIADATGSVKEDVDVTGGFLTDTGTIPIQDDDTTDTHSVTNVDQGSNLGSLSASVVNGEVEWIYSVDNSLSGVQQLAKGDELVEDFFVDIFDGTETTTVKVSVTIQGTNTAPTIDAIAGTFQESDITTGGDFVIDVLDAGNANDVDAGDFPILDSITGTVNLALQALESGEINFELSIDLLESIGLIQLDPNGEVTVSAELTEALGEMLNAGDQLTVDGQVNITDNHPAPDTGQASANLDLTVNGEDGPAEADPNYGVDVGQVVPDLLIPAFDDAGNPV